jgi:hypothetical protein
MSGVGGFAGGYGLRILKGKPVVGYGRPGAPQFIVRVIAQLITVSVNPPRTSPSASQP